MKWIKYQLNAKINPAMEEILTEKKMSYSEANMAIAEREAYNGEITVEEVNDDGES